MPFVLARGYCSDQWETRLIQQFIKWERNTYDISFIESWGVTEFTRE
jgi:hypothetical protein